MLWNWELVDWPQFIYDPTPIAQLDRQFLLNSKNTCSIKLRNLVIEMAEL